MIPKIIWQTHNYHYEDLPKCLAKASRTWKNINPEWDYRYIDNKERDEYIESQYPEIYDFYLRCSPTLQADIWRVVVGYDYGGVYVDMDSVCIMPLDQMLENYESSRVLVAKEYEDLTINNAFFAVQKKSIPFKNVLRELMLDIINKKESVDHWYVWTIFNKHVFPRSNDCFIAGYHSDFFKKKFKEFEVNYYGTKMQYRDYLKNIAKLDEEEYNKSINL